MIEKIPTFKNQNQYSTLCSVSLVAKDSALSRQRPGFKSRTERTAELQIPLYSPSCFGQSNQKLMFKLDRHSNHASRPRRKRPFYPTTNKPKQQRAKLTHRKPKVSELVKPCFTLTGASPELTAKRTVATIVATVAS